MHSFQQNCTKFGENVETVGPAFISKKKMMDTSNN